MSVSVVNGRDLAGLAAMWADEPCETRMRRKSAASIDEQQQARERRTLFRNRFTQKRNRMLEFVTATRRDEHVMDHATRGKARQS